MKNSFGTFTTLQDERESARYRFWYVVESEARQVIKDLSLEPFQAYQKALELNGGTFHHQSFGYPASKVFFVNPESVKDFHIALAVWQRKYNLCHTDENLKPLSFDEYFIYSHNDFYPNIAAYILKKPEKKTFDDFQKLTDAEKDEIRIQYIQSKRLIVGGEYSTADRKAAEKFLESIKASYQNMSEEKLKSLKAKETDWIPAKACQFLWHWSEFPKNYENLFLMNAHGLTGFIDETAPKGFDEFAAHFETPEIYAERMAEKAKEKIKSDEMLQSAPKPDQSRFVESIREKALNHAKEFQKSKLVEFPNLSAAKDLTSLEKHFGWLIKTYVLGKQFVDISNESPNDLDVGGISRNVNKLAVILGLPKPAHLRRGNPNLTSKP